MDENQKPSRELNSILNVNPNFSEILSLRDAIVPENMSGLFDECLALFTAKNNDYGNAFEKGLDVEGLAAYRVMMDFKISRVKSLTMGAKQMVNGESIEDSIKDIAIYSFMTLLWCKKVKELQDEIVSPQTKLLFYAPTAE